jgi:exopolysaccharide production protein ExoQ
MHFVHRQPIWNHVLGWLLLAPLIYLAVYGAFSIDHVGFNNPIAGEYGTLLAGRSKVVPLAEIAVAYGIVGALCFLHFRTLANRCLQFPSLLALPLVAMASTAWSQDPIRSLLFGTLALGATLFAFYLSVRFTGEQQMELFLFVGFIVLLSSIILAVFFPSIGLMQLDGKGAWQGLFNHKNRCAMGMAFLLTPALFVATPHGLGRSLKWVFITLTCFLILMTQSRTGWIILFLLLLFVPVVQTLTHVSGRERFLIAIIFAAIAVSVSLLIVNNYAAIALAMGKNADLTGRLPIWRAVMIPIFKRPMLGFGYSAFWLGVKGESLNVVLATGYRNLANAENGILQMWLELGLVGLSIFLYTLFEACKNALFCLRAGCPAYVKWFSAILFLELLALVDGGKFMAPNSLDWILYLLCCLGLGIQARGLKVLQHQARLGAFSLSG